MRSPPPFRPKAQLLVTSIDASPSNARGAGSAETAARRAQMSLRHISGGKARPLGSGDSQQSWLADALGTTIAALRARGIDLPSGQGVGVRRPPGSRPP